MRLDVVQVFFWMAEDPCKQPRQLSHKDMKPCVFHKGHDYFQGSELAYLLGILLLVCFPLVVVFLAYLAIKVGAAIAIKLELQTIHRFSQLRSRPLLGPTPG